MTMVNDPVYAATAYGSAVIFIVKLRMSTANERYHLFSENISASPYL